MVETQEKNFNLNTFDAIVKNLKPLTNIPFYQYQENQKSNTLYIKDLLSSLTQNQVKSLMEWISTEAYRLNNEISSVNKLFHQNKLWTNQLSKSEKNLDEALLFVESIKNETDYDFVNDEKNLIVGFSVTFIEFVNLPFPATINSLLFYRFLTH